MEPTTATPCDADVRQALAAATRTTSSAYVLFRFDHPAHDGAFVVGQLRAALRAIIGRQHTLLGQAEAALDACMVGGLPPKVAGRCACEAVALRAESLAKLNANAIRSATSGDLRNTYAENANDLARVAKGLHELARSLSS